MRWVKMESLSDNDPAMWLSQVQRFATGELPYRDFSWNYPPFAIYLLGTLARWFGVTFAVLQIAMDVISLVVVLLVWWLGRRLLPPAVRLVTAVGVVAVCATSLTKFNLFSFATYSPSLEIAAIGLLSFLIGGVRRLQGERNEWMDGALLAGGIFIASITKPEALVAAWGGIGLLILLDSARRLKFYGWVAAIAGIASAAVYVAAGSAAGFNNLKAGVGGYGLASFACPWWPTGLGLFGAAASTGEALFLGVLLAVPVRRALRQRVRINPAALWVAAAAGLLVFAAYVWYQSGATLLSDAPMSLKFEVVGRALFWTSPVLLPVMWGSICVWLVLVSQWRRLTQRSRVLIFVLAIPVAISIRGLFGTTLFPYTEVSALCYPFFVMAAAWLIDGLYAWLACDRPALSAIAIVATIGTYSLLRLIGAYPGQLSNRDFYRLDTRAGTVRLSDGHLSEQIYSYILANSRPGDSLLDFPYGGGFNFATGLLSPAFTTQYQQLRMPRVYQMQDLARFENDPPRIVVGSQGLHFDTQWGYAATMTCPFPRFVWEPDEPSWDPGYVFPLVRYIEGHYHIVSRIGSKLILKPSTADQSATAK